MKSNYHFIKILIGLFVLFQLSLYSQETEKSGTANLTNGSNNAEIKMMVYPNPAVDEVTLELSNNNNMLPCNLFIYNIVGELIEKIEIKDLKTTIHLSEYKSGAYYLQLIDKAGQAKTKRLVVK